MPHLFVDISSHGLGHLAQTAPVLNALAERLPGLRLTLRSGLAPEMLRARIRPAFEHIPGRSDFGFVMIDATRIDREATAVAYREWHADWPRRVAEDAALLKQLAPDLVLTDVAYLPLAAAAVAGIPSLAMSSLNWADLFEHTFDHEPWAARIHGEILAAYRSACCFLRLTPAMPMPGLPRTRTIAPVASLGQDRLAELDARLPGPAGEKRVLVAFGGFDKPLAAERWPHHPGVRWLVPAHWDIRRPDFSAFAPLGLPFTDLLRSVDAVLTKPGYGTFTEAACNGTPVVFLRRDDWPEQDCLIDWLAAHGRGLETTEADLLSGMTLAGLRTLWEETPPPPPLPSGAEEAAALIAEHLSAPVSPVELVESCATSHRSDASLPSPCPTRTH